MVKAMDAQIGQILATIEAAGMSEDTIIVFTSDNGGERYSDTWPFSGKKSELLEGGLRIPAIAQYPRHVPAGTISEQTIDRKSVVEGKSVAVRVDPGGRRLSKKKDKTAVTHSYHTQTESQSH